MSTWHILEQVNIPLSIPRPLHLRFQAPPPSLREILGAYRSKGDGDRDLLIAMLNAKSAEDQVGASPRQSLAPCLYINSARRPLLPCTDHFWTCTPPMPGSSRLHLFSNTPYHPLTSTALKTNVILPCRPMDTTPLTSLRFPQESHPNSHNPLVNVNVTLAPQLRLHITMHVLHIHCHVIYHRVLTLRAAILKSIHQDPEHPWLSAHFFLRDLAETLPQRILKMRLTCPRHAFPRPQSECQYSV